MADNDREEAAQRRTRQRFLRRQWARRWMSWRYVVAVVAVLVLLGAGIWLVFFSTQMSVRTVEVRGNEILSDKRVRTIADVRLGAQLATADLDRPRARLSALAEVESVDVTREWPDTVAITVTERTAVAVVRIGSQWRALDASGVVFTEYQRPPANLPRVQASANAGEGALEEAALVVSQLPADLAARVDHVEVDTIDTITLVLPEGRTVHWGSSEQSDVKADVLVKLMQAHPAQEYDVSVPGMPTAR